MAKAIVENIHAHPEDRHLAMVTRRQFGYWLRDRIFELDLKLRLDLGFSEGLLDSWAAREAFLVFCLLIDPDRPTWRAWLGLTLRQARTSRRQSGMRMCTCNYLHRRTMPLRKVVEALAAEERGKSRGRAVRPFGIGRSGFLTCAKIDWTARMRRALLRHSSTRNSGSATTTKRRSWRGQCWICVTPGEDPRAPCARAGAQARTCLWSISTGSPNVCGTRSPRTNRSRPTTQPIFGSDALGREGCNSGTRLSLGRVPRGDPGRAARGIPRHRVITLRSSADFSMYLSPGRRRLRHVAGA